MITIDDETLKTYAYINISSYRVKTVKALKNEVLMPTQIAKDAGIRTNHISKVLSELKEAGIAECINEEARKGRLYRLTDKCYDSLINIFDNCPEMFMTIDNKVLSEEHKNNLIDKKSKYYDKIYFFK